MTNKTRMTITLDNEIIDYLKLYKQETNISSAKVINEALKYLIENDILKDEKSFLEFKMKNLNKEV